MSDIFFTVSQLNEFLKAAFDTSKILSDISIKGEISNFTHHYKTGHFYFFIKDEDSLIRAVMFRLYTTRLKFVPENGMKVIAHGKIAVFVRDGSYSLQVDDIIPDGVGSLYTAYEKLKSDLEKEGLFDERHKKQIPKFPHKIGILTSPTGSVIRDIINVSSRRYPLAELIIFPCTVQGDDAVGQLIYGLKSLEKTDADTIIIARGGGSLEDLAPFNNEMLARAIFECKKPVISAVGHETDFTICDFVSDLRAPTPSAAAELALPEANELALYLTRLNNLLENEINLKITQSEKCIELISKNYVFQKPGIMIDDMQKILNNFSSSIKNNIEMILEYKQNALSWVNLNDKINRILEQKENLFSSAVSKVEMLSPLAVISRGYSVVFKDDGVLYDIEDAKLADKIDIQMRSGKLNAEVTGIERKNL